MMRAVYAVAIGLGLAALSASPAFALAQTIKVHVPFAFNVAGKTLPAGDYFVRPQSDAESAVLEIRSTNGRYAALALAASASPGPRFGEPEMVFDKYGSKEYLHAIRVPGAQGAVLEPSPSELRETKAASSGLGPSVGGTR